MRANPGGVIGPKDVIGRDDLISQLWEILRAQSIVLTSERRIGKTCVIRKMHDENTSATFLCIMRDLEGLRSPQQFVERTYEDIESFLPRTDRARLKVWQLLTKLGGAQIGDIKLPHLTQHWKNLLDALMEDLFEAEKRIVVFFWDELPLFIHNVKQDMREPTAMEILDVLRSLRQRHKRLRMVFTGSVGLHQVIRALRSERYANAPTNDMRPLEVGPISPAHGAQLAALLVEGEEIAEGPEASLLASQISEATGHIPYYIHYLVARMKSQEWACLKLTAEEHLESLISDPNDPADFRYYRTRLHTYYDEAEGIALAILDVLAIAQEPLTFDSLINGVRHHLPTNEERVRDTLQLLMKDHYITRRQKDRRFEFRYPVVRKWWRFDRG